MCRAFIGALLMMISDNLDADYVTLRALFDSSRGDQLLTFSSLRKRMTVLLLNGKDGKSGISYTKGATY